MRISNLIHEAIRKLSSVTIYEKRHPPRTALFSMKAFPYNRIPEEKAHCIMAFDFKKEYKEFYMPKNRPSIKS